MAGYQPDNWEVLLIVLLLLSFLVLLVAAPVAVGGLVVWLVRRRLPGSRFVRACMATTGALVALWGFGLAVNKVFFGPETPEILTIQTTGRICRAGVMGGPVGLCEDMHLCAAVPDSFDALLTEQPAMPELAGCTAGTECELQIVWKSAVRLGDDSDEWIIAADQASIDDPDPESYPQSLIWFKTVGPPTDPMQAVPIGNNDAGYLIYSLQTSVTDYRAHFAHVSGPPSPDVCAWYLADPSERTYEFTSN